MSIDEPDLNFGLVRLGQTVTKEITVNNMSQIITSWSIQDSPAFPSSDDDMVGTLKYEQRHEKIVFGFPTRTDTNQTVQPQKMTRGLKFWI